MRRKISAPTLVFALVALSCTVPALARADIHLSFGTRWEPLRYTTAAFPFAPTAPKIGGTSGFESTSLDPYLALFFARKYGIVLGLDIGYGKVGTDTTTGMTTVSTNDSYFQFGFSLGFKFYITEPRKEKVSPFIYADFYKYFASVSTDKMSVTGDQAGFQASLLSPIGGTIAFGAEYFVTPGFSIGSEVFGLKIANVSGSQMNGMMDANYTYVTFYTAITLNYRFQVQTSVQVEEEQTGEEQPQPPKKKKKVKPQPEPTEEEGTPPPTPPPPSPEAVD